MRLRTLLYLMLAAGPGWSEAPFLNLATNGDGSVLYFSSSLRMRGTSQYAHPKIFVWTVRDGVRLYAQRPPDRPAHLQVFGWMSQSFFELIAPKVSSDGLVVVFTERRPCTSGTPCATEIKRYQSVVRLSNGRELLAAPGGATISPNGRYVLTFTSRFQVPDDPRPADVLFDLQTGARWQFPGGPPDPSIQHAISNNGTILVGIATEPYTAPWRPSDGVLASGARWAGSGELISATGGLALTFYGGWAVRDLRYGTATTIASDLGSGHSISDDLSRIAYVDPAISQARIIMRAGSGAQTLATAGDPAQEVQLSGDRRFAFVATEGGHVLRFDTATLQSVEVIAPPPLISPSPDSPVTYLYPGTLAQLTGSNLAPASASAPAPFPNQLSGVQVLVNGKPAPVASVAPGAVTFQTPWDAPDGYAVVEVQSAHASASPFNGTLEVEGIATPKFFFGPSGVLAAHQDFSSLVLTANPAALGEILHVYGTGFGPVAAVPPLGAPTPAAPLAGVVGPFS